MIGVIHKIGMVARLYEGMATKPTGVEVSLVELVLWLVEEAIMVMIRLIFMLL